MRDTNVFFIIHLIFVFLKYHVLHLSKHPCDRDTKYSFEQ